MQIGDLYLDNNFFLAPLAGISNLPFRLLNKDYGCALVYTEMISVQGLIRRGKKTFNLMISDEREKPVTFQIFGSDPAALADAAKICEERGADIIDINMGCPVKKVVRNGAGAALLSDPDKVRSIIKSVRNSINIPLTIKLRLGLDHTSLTYLKIAAIAEAQGADAICLHPRTKNQGFKGEIDTDALKTLKQSVKVPVIGSGNLFTADDAREMLAKTGCDAVMLARGALGNPFIFEELIANSATHPHQGRGTGLTPMQSTGERFRLKKVILKHIDYFLEFYNEKKCHKEMKKHLLWYTKGLQGSSEFRQKVVHSDDLPQMRRLLDDYLGA